MNKIKNQIIGVVAFLLVFVGMTNAANQIDPASNEVVEQQNMDCFATFCSDGGEPK